MMPDIYGYEIWLYGKMHTADFKARSPIHFTVTKVESGATCLTIHTDQSGCVGALRYLHGLGFEILSVHRMQAVDSTFS